MGGLGGRLTSWGVACVRGERLSPTPNLFTNSKQKQFGTFCLKKKKKTKAAFLCVVESKTKTDK